jgi:tripartite-type tricarboxylate transporter receptor subunit TctC
MRNTCSRMIGILLCATLFQGTAQAQSERWPVKPVRFVLPFGAPGGAPDAMARALQPRLAEAWGQPMIIDVRSGGGGVLATDHVAKAAPDGYTLLMTSSSHVITPALNPGLSYHPIRDFTPVTLMAEVPNILFIHPSVPARTVKEFIAHARSHPGKLNYGSPGVGSGTHIFGELFAKMAGVKLVHVPYKTSGALATDLMSGLVQASFGSATVMPSVRAGKVIALGATGARRISTLPDLPTIAEGGLPGYAATNWYALLGPAGTPRVAVDRLWPEIQRVFRLEEVRQVFGPPMVEPINSTPQELAAFLPVEMDKWATIIREAGIKAE